ncbi:hypothetical protein OS493_008041 [Desmophyllum pertusum]|uniref:Uncharacterized protein n=1 Tax=Desmophyllum pertusum TaxID=174260 RepID=A0A9W9YEY3_9CNID|nr:hypothetical protein OS493_008041 [Desmophyllum pertusum]
MKKTQTHSSTLGGINCYDDDHRTNRFTKCGVCLLINEHIQATRNKEKRFTWSQKKKLHMDQTSVCSGLVATFFANG